MISQFILNSDLEYRYLNVEITILEIRGDQIKIGVNAPKEVPVYRKEVYLQIQKENRASVAEDKMAELKNLFG